MSPRYAIPGLVINYGIVRCKTTPSSQQGLGQIRKLINSCQDPCDYYIVNFEMDCFSLGDDREAFN